MAEQSMEERMAIMEKEVERLKAIESIRKVEHAYSYYLLMWMHEEIIDLFAARDDTTLEWPQGIFIGKEAPRQYFSHMNPNKDPEFMHQMMHLSDVIDIAEDGNTGQGRWWGFGAMALPRGNTGVTQTYGCGIYENDFIKEDGVWKLWKIRWVHQYSSRPTDGWVKPERLSEFRPSAEGEHGLPDWWKVAKPPKGIDYSYPSGYIFPFHFNHPVTGKPTTEGEWNARLK